jgi:hypothetical protein
MESILNYSANVLIKPSPRNTINVNSVEKELDFIKANILNNEVVTFIVKIVYQDIRDPLCREVYDQIKNNPFEILTPGLLLDVLKCLLASPDTRNVKDIYDLINIVFDKHYNEVEKNLHNFYILNEIYDIFHQFYPAMAKAVRPRIDEYKHSIQHLLPQPQPKPKPHPPKPIIKNIKTIYTNNQNVHDSTIIQSSLKAMKYIISLYASHDKDSVATIFNHLNLTHLNNLQNRMSRSNVNGVYLDLILQAIWCFICEHEHKDEIKNILKEELIIGNNYCTSGLACRMINAIQGFFNEEDHPSMVIKVEDFSRQKSMINAMVQKMCEEKGIDPVYDKLIFIEELQTVIKNNAVELLIENQTIDQLITTAMKIYNLDGEEEKKEEKKEEPEEESDDDMGFGLFD